jgi:hypothetical protein
MPGIGAGVELPGFAPIILCMAVFPLIDRLELRIEAQSP